MINIYIVRHETSRSRMESLKWFVAVELFLLTVFNETLKTASLIYITWINWMCLFITLIWILDHQKIVETSVVSTVTKLDHWTFPMLVPEASLLHCGINWVVIGN